MLWLLIYVIWYLLKQFLTNNPGWTLFEITMKSHRVNFPRSHRFIIFWKYLCAPISIKSILYLCACRLGCKNTPTTAQCVVKGDWWAICNLMLSGSVEGMTIPETMSLQTYLGFRSWWLCLLCFMAAWLTSMQP